MSIGTRHIVVLFAGLLHLAGGDGETDFKPLATESPLFMTALETRRQTGYDIVYPVDTSDNWLPYSTATDTFPVFLNSIPLVFRKPEGQSRRQRKTASRGETANEEDRAGDAKGEDSNKKKARPKGRSAGEPRRA